MSQHKDVTLIEVNVDNPGAQSDYMKLEQQGQGIPQVVLLNGKNQVVTHWVGYMAQADVDHTLEEAMAGHGASP